MTRWTNQIEKINLGVNLTLNRTVAEKRHSEFKSSNLTLIQLRLIITNPLYPPYNL